MGKLSKEQINTAQRIENEINKQDARGNHHLAEERGQVPVAEENNEE